MAKYSDRLPKTEVDAMLYKLCRALSSMKNEQEMAVLLRDLLSLQEARMLAKRLKIAELLQRELTFSEIESQLKVSPTTIARIHEWLRASGEGYRLALERTNTKREISVPSFGKEITSWHSLKRRYPMYYWPELLLEEVVKTAGVRKQAQLRMVIAHLEQSGEKTPIFKHLKKYLS